MSSFYIYSAMASSLASDGHGLSAHRIVLTFSTLSKLGPGFHYSLIGFVFVVGFTARVALGSASLPLALPKSSVLHGSESNSWHRVEIFVWMLVALLPAVRWALPVLNLVFNYIYVVQAHIPAFDVAADLAQVFVAETIVVLLAIWIIGSAAWRALRRSLRWPATSGLALAVAFPVGIAVLIDVGQLLFTVLRWAAYQSASMPPPRIGSYLTFPGPGLLMLLPFALCEEVIFRGILQPLFVSRYGVLVGIFLVAIVFGAWHFYKDFSVAFTDGLIMAKLWLRLIESLALSFVAGWLVLRTRSVLPAGIAHGLMNVLGGSPLAPAFPWIGPTISLLWAVLAYLLFRYWPIQAEAVQGPGWQIQCLPVGSEEANVGPRTLG